MGVLMLIFTLDYKYISEEDRLMSRLLKVVKNKENKTNNEYNILI